MDKCYCYAVYSYFVNVATTGNVFMTRVSGNLEHDLPLESPRESTVYICIGLTKNLYNIKSVAAAFGWLQFPI